jgi:hypothetical protein
MSHKIQRCPRGLCWARESSIFLKAYRGNVVIWIGEKEGGCTASMDRHIEWREGVSLTIPRWPGINDFLCIYHRKGKGFTSQIFHFRFLTYVSKRDDMEGKRKLNIDQNLSMTIEQRQNNVN